MAEAVLQGVQVRGDVAQGSAIKALGAIGLAVARGAGLAFRAVSSVIQFYRPVAQGFLMSNSTATTMQRPGQS